MNHNRRRRLVSLACAAATLLVAFVVLRRRDDEASSDAPHLAAKEIVSARSNSRERGDPVAVDPTREAVAPVPVEPLTGVASSAGACAPGTICGVVVTRGGRALPGAVCSLCPSDAPIGFRFARGLREVGEPVAKAITDASGAFSLPAPEGFWTLRVAYAGLRSWREDALASGSYRRVVLDRARVLALHVVDEGGAPVADARLLLLADPYSNPGSAHASARSDADGRAELELPPGGSWFVATSHPSFRSDVLAVPSSEDAPRIEQTVTLSKGIRVFGRVTSSLAAREPLRAEVVIDVWGPAPTTMIACDAQGRFDSGPVLDPEDELELTARAAGHAEIRTVVRLAPEDTAKGEHEIDLVLDAEEVRVVGRVVTSDGRPPGPVDLLLQPLADGAYLEAQKLISPAVQWRAQATTDASGAFELDGLMARHGYRLLVLPREHLGNALVRIPGAEPGTVVDLGRIAVEAGGTLFGFARHPDGTPVPHLQISGIAAVYITWEQARDPAYFPASEVGRQDAYTNDDGRFEFALLPGGATYNLYWGDGRIDEDRHVGRYEIRAGESIGPVDVLVPSAGRVRDATLSGIVTDATGAPLDSILVEAWRGPATAVIGEGFERGQLTDASGAFALAELSAGEEYRVTATDLRGRFEKAQRSARANDALVLALAPSPVAPARLEGIVIDAAGRPLAGVDLALYLSPLLVRCDCLAWRQTTDEFGTFSFGAVTDGEHQVAAVDPSGRHRATIVRTRPGSYLSIRME